RPPYSFRARADWRDLDLGPWLSALPDLEVASRGEAVLSGDLGQPLAQGAATISSLSFAHGGERLHSRNPIVISATRGVVQMREAVLEGSGQRVTLGGRWSRDGAEATLAADIDLALVEAVRSDVVSSQGKFAANLRASQNATGPWRFGGHAELRDGA